MAETLKPPHVPHKRPDWDSVKAFARQRREAIGAFVALGVLASIFAANQAGLLDSVGSTPSDSLKDNGGGDKGVAAPVVPGKSPSANESKPSNDPTNSGGDFSNYGRVTLSCVNIEIEKVNDDLYKVSPVVEDVIGDKNSPYVYTMLAGYDNVRDDDVIYAKQGVQSFNFQPSRFSSYPAVVIVDVHDSPFKPGKPDQFPGIIGDTIPDNQMYPCPSLDLALLPTR
ncbi:MAG TPA: hypothetical protein VLA92_01255 [Candidatus Saccharimonadales bacterium]|nr:hypothetical protein [Candidatus Saccharimonadales bacterium]